MLKVGDWVRYIDDCKTFFWYKDGVFIVKGITTDDDVMLSNGELIASDWLSVVCDLTIGEAVQYGNKDTSIGEGSFYSFDGKLKKSYLVLNKYGDVSNWEYCRRTPCYKPYSVPDLKWVNNKVIMHKDSRKLYSIVKLEYTDKWKVVLIPVYENIKVVITLNTMFNEYEWYVSGDVCGEEITEDVHINPSKENE